jgi:hypothetical protein
LIERLSRSQWSKVQAPNASADATLNSISCPTRTFCVAVGASSPSGSGTPSASLVETWNGSSWTAAPGLLNGSLNEASCSSASECMAIGEDQAGNGQAEAWNGTRWRSIPPPSPFGQHAHTLLLTAVLCRAHAACVVAAEWEGWIGNEPNGDWTESAFFQLTTRGWVLESGGHVHGPGFPGNANQTIISLSCVGRFCEGVGSWYEGISSDAFVESGEGDGWKMDSFPQVADNAGWTLLGVSCPLPQYCIAVGTHPGLPPSCPCSTGHVAVSSVLQGGRWRLLSNPGRVGDQLWSVACTSRNDCVAVGADYSNPAGHFQSGLLPPAELWNGSAWTTMRTALLPIS